MEELGFKSRSVGLHTRISPSSPCYPVLNVCATRVVSSSLSLTSPFHLDKHTFYISFFTAGACCMAIEATRHHQWALPKDRMFTHGDLAKAHLLFVSWVFDQPATHSRDNKGCLVCAYLCGLPLSLSRWKRKQAGKKVDKPHILSPPLMAPVNCNILSPQKAQILLRGPKVRWGRMAGILKHTEFQNMKPKRKVYPRKKNA